MILLEQMYLAAQSLSGAPSAVERLQNSYSQSREAYLAQHFSTAEPRPLYRGFQKPTTEMYDSSEMYKVSLFHWDSLQELIFSDNPFKHKKKIVQHLLELTTLHKELTRDDQHIRSLDYKKRMGIKRAAS